MMLGWKLNHQKYFRRQECILIFSLLSDLKMLSKYRPLTGLRTEPFPPSSTMSSRETLSHPLLLNFMDNIHVLFHILIVSFITFSFPLCLSAQLHL